MNPDERAAALTDAYISYRSAVSLSYDEVAKEVIERVQHKGSMTKLDIAALTTWKRLRANTKWVSQLMSTPDHEVQTTTRAAVTAARDSTVSAAQAASTARRALSPLPGFDQGDAIASALCFVAAPDRLAVYDRRAHRGLDLLGYQLDHRPGRYGRYIACLQDCVDFLAGHDGRSWTLREVDVALFQLGRSSGS